MRSTTTLPDLDVVKHGVNRKWRSVGGECGKVGCSLPAAQWMMDECAAVALCTEYRVFEFFYVRRTARRMTTIRHVGVAGTRPQACRSPGVLRFIYNVTFSAPQRVTSHLCNRTTWVRVLSGSDGEPCCLRVADLVDHYSLRQKQRNEKDRPTSRHDQQNIQKYNERTPAESSRASLSTAPSKCF